VQLAGRYGLDRIRVYAALIGEEAAVHAAAGEAEDAARRARRALELYAAGSLAGLTLLPADRERIRALVETVGLGQLEARFAAELGRLLA
jgi:L-alanine-DL-glutamate epimerase-like enolase superfamily enzyme